MSPRNALATGALLAATCAAARAQEPLALDLGGEFLGGCAADIDGDGADDWVASVRRPAAESGATRALRVFRFATEDGAIRTRSFESAVPEDAVAIACAEALPLPGAELLVFDAQGLRIHPLEPAPPGAERPLRWHPQGRTALEAESFLGAGDPSALLLWPYLRTRGHELEVLFPLVDGYARLHLDARTGRRRAERYELRSAIGARRVWDGSLFTAERELPLPTLADLDGDDRDELVIEDASDGALWCCALGAEPLRSALPLGASGARGGALEKSFRRLVDLDGDRRADLLSWVVRGDAQKGFAFETELEIHRGLGGSPPRFAAPLSLRFRGAGSVAALPDLDGDGRADLVLVRCENPATAILGGLATLRYAVYLAREDGAYPSQPELELGARLPIAFLREEELRAGILPQALRFDRDFDGDGTHDLLELDPRRGIGVRRGVLERREHDGRTWTTYRLEEAAWFHWEGRASFETAVLRAEGRAVALVVPEGRAAIWLALPQR